MPAVPAVLQCAETLDAIARWADLLRAVDRDTGPGSGVEAIERISCYFLRVTEIPPEVLHAACERILQRPEDTIMSTAEKLLKEGEARGVLRGTQKSLLQLLAKRFGAVSDAVATRVNSATQLELDRWFDRVLDAKTLEELFAAR